MEKGGIGMIRKMSRVISLLLLISYLGFTVPVWGASVDKGSIVTYEMKDIKVQYAASFTAYPVGMEKSSVVTSVYGAVYNQTAAPLQVLYGVVKLTLPSGDSFTEQYISVTDGVYTTRGLSNGGSSINNAQNLLRGYVTEFVTGKKLQGSSVVKDYSNGWKTISLSREWDEYGNPTQFGIAFKWDLVGVSDPFFQKLRDTSYVVDLTTLRTMGANQAVLQ
jgi:hypothetical protein